MSAGWDAAQYLRFADERTQPCRDLAARISVSNPGRIIDLGCGPGNSTAVLAERWPGAAITGLDNSPEMLKAAAGQRPAWQWQQGDIFEWAVRTGDPYDIVFSNAALQWVPDHSVVLRQLFRHVPPGGALAVQVPAYDSPAHRVSRALAPAGMTGDWHTHPINFYYDVLAPHAARVELWETEYVHIMDSQSAIVEWYKGTGLRPYLAALPDPEKRERFLAAYLDGLEKIYPRQADGRVLFPFRRIFFVAYR